MVLIDGAGPEDFSTAIAYRKGDVWPYIRKRNKQFCC